MKLGLACLSICFGAATVAQQQSTSPQLGYAYPAGGRQGKSVDVVLGGQRLAGNVRILAGPGIQATVVEYTRPMTQKELQDTRDKLEAAAKKLGIANNFRPGLRTNPAQLARAVTEASISEKDMKRFFDFIRERSDPKKQANPQLAESLNLKIDIAPDAQPGLHELRVVSPLGISNPIRFYVGQVPENNEVEPNDVDPCPVDLGPAFVLNGQVMPGEEDAFSFDLKKGQPIQVSAMARGITPYLADAVPGWFQAHLSLKGPDGHEVAYADHNEFNQDPVMNFTPPKDGKYSLTIRDSIYRGREDFVYRIYVGPPAPEPKLKLPAADAVEKEPNNASKQAISVSLPWVVSGAISSPGDVDYYKINGKAGDKLAIEVTARRAGSPLDSSITVTDPGGKIVAYNDDFEDKSAGLITHQADSYVSLALPAAGSYWIAVRDTQTRGGKDYRYSLRISRTEPDFELRVVPSSVTLRPGISTPVTVFALRKDGFNGDIKLQLANPPRGVTMSGGWIPAGTDKTRVTLTGNAASSEPLALQLTGSASVGGKEIVRNAVPAEDMMQAFAYRHLVPVSSWLALSIGRNARAAAGFTGPDKPVQIPSTGTTKIRLAGPGKFIADSMSFELSDAPAGLTVKSVTGVEGALIVELQADPAKLKVGTKGNLILDMFTERTNALAKRANARKTLVGCLPAISFEVVR